MPGTGARWWRPLIWLVGAALIVNASVFVWYHVTQPYDPLGEYPVQDVTLADEPAGDGPIRPVLHYRTGDETLPVTGRKCVNVETPIPVETQIVWRRAEPPGFHYSAPPGVATRQPGCQSFRFQNAIPHDVRDEIARLHRAGVDTSTWQIQGQETPQRDGQPGAPRFYETENFEIRYEGG